MPALLKWQEVFGNDFRALLVFAYHIVSDAERDKFDDLFAFRDREYAFYGVWADDYRQAMQTRIRKSSLWPHRKVRGLGDGAT